MNESLSEKTLEELQTLLAGWGEPKFRAGQVYAWLSKGVRPEDMTNLPKTLRERLSTLPYGGARIYDKRLSEKDGTIKYLFALEDGNLVEGVLMRYAYGNTLCISTQVGCRMGCAFCASTLEGCVRNLTAGEMLGFISCVEADVPHQADAVRTVTNIVLMGSGEPLDNYDNVVRFLRMVSDEKGKNISPRNISLSTCGLVPKLLRFTEEAPHVTLSVSLHAPNNTVRDQIMPVNHTYPMEQLLAAAKNYAEKTGRRVIFEYALIDGLNSDKAAADELADKLRAINCHVNLIPLNHVEERNLRGVTRKQAEQFMAWLDKRHISATIRREMGSDIQGACGQLRRSVLQNIEKGESGT
ncbi:MAG: 23S rRNA (adenine(2503)-C(2))-methyltransferase RlmN [Eubacteriales bacterium]|nr:23S rRNA (adenine(2503)-C(2))-methyltransferase RlmN [Eubacteriales bacterium]